MPRPRQSKQLEDISNNSVASFIERANAIVAATFRGGDVEAETQKLARLFSETMTLADLTGRATLIEQAMRSMKKQGKTPADAEHGVPLRLKDDTALGFRPDEADHSPVVPGTDFDDAVEDIVSRVPILQQEMSDGRPRYLQIADLYENKHAFGLARSFSDKLTQRVQSIIKKSIADGTPIKTAQEAIQKAGDFSRSYAELTYRTNLVSAYTAGTFQEMQDPVVQLVFGALEFVAVLDDDTRENHSAAHGLVAAIDDPIWDSLSPPLGYNCRCAVFPVDFLRLEEMGLVKGGGSVKMRRPTNFAAASADAVGHFGRRPDGNIYG
jgi:SPP1 gp7 family putative phage head morphogenesis protein